MKKNEILKDMGCSYLGAVNQSHKMHLSFINGCMTYCIYLAPADLSGYNVCPNSKHCRKWCLNGSGHNKIEMMSGISEIQDSRIRKTRYFFEHRTEFMILLVMELERYANKAAQCGMSFAVRLNGTSDISPEEFVLNGINILEIFPDIQFYDYTKVPERYEILNKYPNYDLTFSFDGYNWDECEKVLNNNGRVAVVFDEMPEIYKGYPVMNADGYDMRFSDPIGVICGLTYHRVANNYKNGHYEKPRTPFLV